MTVEDRRGAAYHEAGHIVVAWALGLRVGAAAIGINGDDAKGESEIERDETALPLIDKIAICAGGVEAQHVFRTPTHDLAGAMDEAEIIKLTEHLDDETARLALRDEGYQRAHELIVAHKAKIDRIAKRLLARGAINEAEVCSLLQ
jgi:ATP-dependent Zn protease